SAVYAAMEQLSSTETYYEAEYLPGAGGRTLNFSLLEGKTTTSGKCYLVEIKAKLRSGRIQNRIYGYDGSQATFREAMADPEKLDRPVSDNYVILKTPDPRAHYFNLYHLTLASKVIDERMTDLQGFWSSREFESVPEMMAKYEVVRRAEAKLDPA